MDKVAVVTGGTRGIGHAISVELKSGGYRVAAIYGGNDAAAHKFQAETNIPIFKWDVGDYDACVAGLKQVESQLGADFDPGEQRRHHARCNASPDDAATMERRNPHRSRQRVQHGAAHHQWNA